MVLDGSDCLYNIYNVKTTVSSQWVESYSIWVFSHPSLEKQVFEGNNIFAIDFWLDRPAVDCCSSNNSQFLLIKQNNFCIQLNVRLFLSLFTSLSQHNILKNSQNALFFYCTVSRQTFSFEQNAEVVLTEIPSVVKRVAQSFVPTKFGVRRKCWELPEISRNNVHQAGRRRKEALLSSRTVICP